MEFAPKRRHRPPQPPVTNHNGRPVLSIRTPNAPTKKHPIVSRLTLDEYNSMNKADRLEALQQAEYDDYGSALPVDLDSLPQPPIGDSIPFGYDKLTIGKAGVLGGRRKRKSRSNKRKSMRKSRKHTRKPKRKNLRKHTRKSKR